jgi:flagellar hook protein FlgE
MDFEKTENSGEWIWNLRCSGDEEILSGGTGKAIFDSDGNLVSFTYDGGVNKLSIDPKSGAGQMDIVIHGKASEGYSGISQFDSVSTLLSRDQDGRKSGTLKDFYVDTEGSVIGLFTNGENLKLAQVALAQFNNSGGLMKANGSNYIATAESGSPKIDAANNLGATIESGSLEVSTVDMADQFTRMIEAQRSYQAAARVITTFDQILEETTRLKR